MRAEVEREQSYLVHRSWTDRVATWIREHIAAALELLGLRLRQEAEVAKGGRPRPAAERTAELPGVRVTDEDRVCLAVDALAARLPRTEPYFSNPTHCPTAVSYARFDQVAADTEDAFGRRVIAAFQQ